MKKLSFVFALIIVLCSDAFIFWSYFDSPKNFSNLFYLFLFQGFFVMLFAMIKVLLLKDNELDNPRDGWANTRLSWVLKVIAPMNIAFFGNIFIFCFGLVLMLLIAIFSINGVSLMRDIFDLSFVFTSVLVLAGVEIIYLILFLFSKNRSSEKIAGLAHQFNLPLALVVVLAFIIMQSTMIFNPYSVSFPFWVIEDSLIIFKFGADIFYSIKLIG